MSWGARRAGVERGDGRLDLVRPGAAQGQGGVEHRQPLVDGGAVPARAVLLLERHALARSRHPGLPPRVVQQHEGQQPTRLGLVGQQVGQQPPQANRLGGQVVPHRRFARGGGVALVEDEVDHLQHRGQPLAELLAGGDLVGDPRGQDLLLGAHEPLGGGHLGLEKGAGDLGGGQRAQRAQGQRDLRGLAQRRVAAGEQQSQSIVGEIVRLLGRLGRLGRLGSGERSLGDGADRGRRRPPPAEQIDRAAAGDGGQPRARPGGDALGAPALERPDAGVLQRLLGDLEVGDRADERGEDPAPLRAKHRLDRLLAGHAPSG